MARAPKPIALASAGFEVIGVDPSSRLLDIADHAIEFAPHGIRDRVRLVRGGLEDLPESVGADFDAVCCHGVVMYLSALAPAIAELAQLTAPGGLVSVLGQNAAGIALRAGMTGDWQGAIDGIGTSTYTNRLGVELARGHGPGDGDRG